MNAFSAKFLEKDYDESYFYKKVIERYPANLYEVLPSYDNFEQKLKKIIYFLEEPSKAMGVFPQWHVMEMASRHVKVILDGQGGDEILAGYDLYQNYYMLDTIKNNLLQLPNSLIGLAKTKGISSLKKLPVRLLEIILNDREIFNGSFLAGKLLRDTSSLILPALLRYEDKIGMAFSIEARLPFLDYRLVNFVFSLGEKYKIQNGWSKNILRQSMRDILPEEIVFRKDKKGFPTPFNSILKQNSKLQKHIPPEITNEWIKWRYLSLSFWREVFEV
jgi:asparagine synthase (glutamine-hydrolysing)